MVLSETENDGSETLPKDNHIETVTLDAMLMILAGCRKTARFVPTVMNEQPMFDDHHEAMKLDISTKHLVSENEIDLTTGIGETLKAARYFEIRGYHEDAAYSYDRSGMYSSFIFRSRFTDEVYTFLRAALMEKSAENFLAWSQKSDDIRHIAKQEEGYTRLRMAESYASCFPIIEDERFLSKAREAGLAAITIFQEFLPKYETKSTVKTICANIKILLGVDLLAPNYR